MSVNANEPPLELEIGMWVWYYPSPGRKFRAQVAGNPRLLGSHTWVVAIDNLPADYMVYTGLERTSVACAAVDRLEVYDEVAELAEYGEKVVTVRMSKKLHGRLIEVAKQERKSMNSLCLEVLSQRVAVTICNND